MAIVATPIFEYPDFWFHCTTQFVPYTTLVIDAAGETVGFIVRAPKAGTISKIAYRVVGVTTPGNADVRLETVDLATGDPSGTLWAANTNATQAISTANIAYTTTLTAGAVVAQGNLLAVSIVNATGNYQIAAVTNTMRGDGGFPYADHYTGAWTKQIFQPVVACEYNDGSYAPMLGTLPPGINNTVTYNTGTTPDEGGMLFTAPVGFRVCGWYAAADFDGDCEIVLYDSNNNVLATCALDKDVRSNTAAGTLVGRFSSQITLTAGASYRLIIKPTTATSLTFYFLDVASAALMDCFSAGSSWLYTSRTDAGAWSETTTRFLPMGLMCDGIDAGTSGSHFIGG